ncbi:Ca-activated chloride channel family protein [Deinobacterium chartae]|uniref:Ca-activated chloride channel family protein n=1 Tax=Deinobacterium chartae TaxID=521158 RepID=A0A841I2S4_9DEIO|nr:VWA domain-containing protein [Deinobacterium chartae]MBB6098648.1 Ca-activated chloride channel family protein [Deinobacterium chartae]
MLEASLKLHREFLLAHSAGQKLFVTLQLRPSATAAAARPRLSVAFVVDTSGSMREVVTPPTERTGEKRVVDGQTYEVVRGGKNKMDLVVESLRGILTSDLLKDDDRLALVKFDDSAEVLVEFTPASERARLIAAAERLTRYSGGTHMGAGLREAARLVAAETGSRRVVLLSDGQTFDEAVVREQTAQLAQARVPVTTVGVGEEVNTDLLIDLANSTQGQPFDVVPDTQNPQPPSVRASDLPAALLGDIQHAANEVVTEVGLSVRTVREVALDRITRVFPTQTEVDKNLQPHPLGNVEAPQGAVYVLEFTLPARPPARMRLAQLGLTYQVPGADYRGEIPPLDVVVEFTPDESRAASIDPEVMQWVQQRNIENLVAQATREARQDPVQAQKTLQLARAMTQRLGNGAMTVALDRAINELEGGQSMSAATAKTLKIGAKTQTLRSGEGSLPSDDEIRRLTGA